MSDELIDTRHFSSDSTWPEVTSPIGQRARVIEALLFVSTEPLSIGKLADLARCQVDEARQAIDLLERQLDDRGINIFRGDDGIELVTAADLAEHLQQLEEEGPTSRLSRPLLETLAAISYLQPTTRAEVEHLRGVNCAKAIYALLASDLVEEIGTRDEPGRPVEYVTTSKLLLSLGLRSKEDLGRLLESNRPPNLGR